MSSSSSGWQIRFARPGDAAQILDIYAPAVLESGISFEDTLPSLSEMQSRILKISANYPWLVAVDALGRIGGYAYASSYRERAAYRWCVEVSVYVAGDCRGRGLARELYARLFALLERQNFVRAFAIITLPNVPSVRLHESAGFKYVGTYTDVGFKKGRWHQVGWWERALGEAVVPPPEPLLVTQLPEFGKPLK